MAPRMSSSFMRPPGGGDGNKLTRAKAAELDGRVVAGLASVESDRGFLRNLYHASELPLPPDITLRTCCNRWNPRADGSKDGTITRAMPSPRGVPLRIRPVETFSILRHTFWLIGLL
jgi:hypothetical protein